MYYIDGTNTTTHVNYKLLDESGKVLKDYVNEACFSAITYAIIPAGTAVVQIYHDKSMVPYKASEIKRWIQEITELGFPATFVEDKQSDTERQNAYVAASVQTDMSELALKLLRHGEEPKQDTSGDKFYRFEIKLGDYTYKSHLVSGLMLVRCLTESLICKVPGIYFEMVDKNPNLDKFQALQDAHKSLGSHDWYDSNRRHNTNHMITHKDNGPNVTKEKLFKNYQACGVLTLDHKGHNLGQLPKWNGNN